MPAGYSKDGGERQICDWCLSTLFFRYRTCRRCGFEVCLHCAEEWRTAGRPPTVAKLCPHPPADWLAFAKVSTHVMLSLSRSATAIGAAHAAAAVPPVTPAPPRAPATVVDGCMPCMHPPVIAPDDDAPVVDSDGASGVPPVGAALGTALNEPTPPSWLTCWRRGEPIVVPRVHVHLREQWTPPRFSHEFGELEVIHVDCPPHPTSLGATWHALLILPPVVPRGR